jgi:hypothetical protein
MSSSNKRETVHYSPESKEKLWSLLDEFNNYSNQQNEINKK